MGKKRTLVIIPTYNESENLERLISEVFMVAPEVEILVVDDNSPDGTGDIAERLALTQSVHVRHRPGKMGLGTAYVEGFQWALEHNYDYVLEMDCDFSHQPRYLPAFLQAIKSADLVIGSRYIQGGSTPDWNALRKLISWGGNQYARLMLGLTTNDATGGFRCYRSEILERVPWQRIQLRGYGFQVGAAYFVEQIGGRIAEIPITFEDRRVGQSKMSTKILLEAFLYVTRMGLTGHRLKKG